MSVTLTQFAIGNNKPEQIRVVECYECWGEGCPGGCDEVSFWKPKHEHNFSNANWGYMARRLGLDMVEGELRGIDLLGVVEEADKVIASLKHSKSDWTQNPKIVSDGGPVVMTLGVESSEMIEKLTAVQSCCLTAFQQGLGISWS